MCTDVSCSVRVDTGNVNMLRACKNGFVCANGVGSYGLGLEQVSWLAFFLPGLLRNSLHLTGCVSATDKRFVKVEPSQPLGFPRLIALFMHFQTAGLTRLSTLRPSCMSFDIVSRVGGGSCIPGRTKTCRQGGAGNWFHWSGWRN